MYKVFKTALTNYLNTNWTATPIRDYDNMPGEPPKFDPWIGVFKPLLIDDGVNAISEGPHCILSNYVIMIPIFIGSAEGVAEAVDLSEELKLLFLGKTLAGNIKFMDINTEFGVDGDGESSGSWYQTDMIITVEHRWFL